MAGADSPGQKALLRLQKIRETFDQAKKYGISMSRHMPAFSGAVAALKEKRFEDAAEKVEALQDAVENSLAVAIKTRLHIGRRLIEKLGARGVETSDATGLFKSLEPLIREKRFFEVLEKCDVLEKMLGDLDDMAKAELEMVRARGHAGTKNERAAEKDHENVSSSAGPGPPPTSKEEIGEGPALVEQREDGEAERPRHGPRAGPQPRPRQEEETRAAQESPPPQPQPQPQLRPVPEEQTVQETSSPHPEPKPQPQPQLRPVPEEQTARETSSPHPEPKERSRVEQDTPQPRPRTVEERQAGEDVGAAVAATVSADGEDAPAPPPASPEERATGMLGELKEQLAEAAGAGMETDKLDEGYRGAEADVVMGEYETATDRMQRLFGELDYARRNFIVESLTYCYNLMQVAPDYIDLSGAKQLYNEGNRLYDQDDVSGALRKTAECRESVDHLKDEHERILQMINQCRKDIEAGTERGVDLSASREKVSAARSHLLSGDFNSALTTVNEARSLIDRANEAAYQEFRQKAWTTYLAAKNMVETAKEEGLSIPDSRELLDRARTAFDLATNVDGFSDMYEAVNLLQQNELDIRREMAARKVEADRLAGEAAQLRSRVRSLSGHMSVANLEGQLSLLDDALSREALTEAEELLEKCSASIDDAVGLSPEIFLEISGEGLRTDVWSQISLVVSNVGGSHARNIRMNFDGPLEVRRVKTIDRLRCGEKKVMEVGIKFNGVGKVPIDVEIIYGRTLDEKQYLFSEETWLEVGSDAGGGGKRVTRIGSSYECSYCRKVIGGDDGVVKCSCNLAYHEHCARKASKCPSCNDDISNRPPIIRSQKVHHVEGRGARGDRSYGGGGALPGVAVEAAGPPAASGGALEDLDGTWLD